VFILTRPLINNASGLSAGICEEAARYWMYRCWIASNSDRNFFVGLLLGSGHGGCEAMIVGIVSLFTLIVMVALRELDKGDSNVAQKYWSTPNLYFFLGFIERITAMTFHTGASILVLQVFVSKSFVWLVAAILFHAFVDALALVMSLRGTSPWMCEVILGLVVYPIVVCILMKSWNAEAVREYHSSLEVPLLQDPPPPPSDDEIDSGAATTNGIEPATASADGDECHPTNAVQGLPDSQDRTAPLEKNIDSLL
jgi:uncharacterized membrane protein YhfC